MKIHEINFSAYSAGHTDGYKDTIVAYASSLSTAQKIANKFDGYGRVDSVNIHHKFVVFDTFEEYETLKFENLAENAKAKLTKEELDALVLSIQKMS